MVKISKTKPLVKKGGKSNSGILNRIKPVQYREAFLKVNLFGLSGTGKTVFASTFPKPMLIVKFEEGTNSVYNVPGIDDVLITNTDEIKELVESEQITKYKTIVVDTATMLQDMVLQEILGLDEIPAQKSWGLATQQDWGQCTLKSKEFLRAFLGLSKQAHVVIINQEREFKSDSNNEIVVPYIAGALTPATSSWLNAACECIVSTFKREKVKIIKTKIGGKVKEKEIPTGRVEFCLRIGPSPIYSTKVRVPRESEVPQFIADPTFDKLYSLIVPTRKKGLANGNRKVSRFTR